MGFARLPRNDAQESGPGEIADEAASPFNDRRLQAMMRHKIQRKAEEGAAQEEEAPAAEGEEATTAEETEETQESEETAEAEAGEEGESEAQEGESEEAEEEAPAETGGAAPASEEAISAAESEGDEEEAPVQMKKEDEVSQPGDAAEVEADQVADQVTGALHGDGEKIHRSVEISAAPAPAVHRKPDPAAWTKPQIEAIQTELKRLKLYTKTVDGLMGGGTRGGLSKAFSGESWNTMTADAIVAQLKGMKLPAAPGVKGAPNGFTADLLKAMQTELARLGLYNKTIDGKWGRGTSGALVEAFGGDEWKTLDADSVVARLKAAKPPEGKKGERNLKYGEMFKDNVLDMTLGVGFDEGGAHEGAIEAFEEVLGAANFVSDKGKAAKIYAQAGREVGESAFGKFFVRENALTYKPPAGPPRQIHAVIRLVSNPDGSKGKEAAGAFKEGMAESDVAYYSGHGRYGSGPDFDRNFGSFKLLGADGEMEEQFTDYEALGEKMKEEGSKKGRGAWEQFMWRVENKRMDVQLSNDGNVFLNAQNKHPGEFGGKLIYWALQQKGGGAAPATGAGGEIDQKMKENEKQDEQRDYRLMVFDGCRTQDYLQSIRGTPGMDTQGADVLSTKRTLNWGDEARTLTVFIEQILGQQSADTIVKEMDKQQSSSGGSGVGNAYQASGLEDNPVFK